MTRKKYLIILKQMERGISYETLETPSRIKISIDWKNIENDCKSSGCGFCLAMLIVFLLMFGIVFISIGFDKIIPLMIIGIIMIMPACFFVTILMLSLLIMFYEWLVKLPEYIKREWFIEENEVKKYNWEKIQNDLFLPCHLLCMILLVAGVMMIILSSIIIVKIIGIIILIPSLVFYGSLFFSLIKDMFNHVKNEWIKKENISENNMEELV